VPAGAGAPLAGGLDGAPLVAGLATLLKQVHPAVAVDFINPAGQYLRALTAATTGAAVAKAAADGPKSAALAACAPAGRKPHDIRGYLAEYKLTAKGNPFQVMVKPFAGRDPADAKAAACLEKALTATQLRCPREATVLTVKTAICL
jgi:hypothetical protein